MNLNMVKESAKEDKATTYYTVLKRNVGILVTWFILNVFPKTTANFVTLCMFPLNLAAAGLLYYAVVTSTIPVLVLAFCLSFFTLTLDSVDGNIARIKKSSSLKGVYLDRLVHNISHPLFFFVIGFALHTSSGQIVYLIIFILVAILSELSPLDVSQKDVEALFIRQAVLHGTRNYSFLSHQFREKSYEPVLQRTSLLRKLLKTIFSNDSYYVVILMDMLLFSNQYYITCIFAFIDILGMIYVRSNITKWESNLRDILERLYRFNQQ